MSGYGFTIPTGGYDAEDRLVTYNRTDTNLDQSWNLSLVGDWNSITTEGVAQSRTHGPSHELLTGGGQNVSTDVKRNITLIPAALRPGTSSLALTWDFDNRLSTADVGNDASIDVTYRFDALGRRVYRDDGTTAMVYVQSGQQTIADYVAGTAATSPTYRYVYASYIDEPVLRYKPVGTESLYYHRNQQYSVTALTDGTGAIVERYAYSAYGVPTIANASGTVLTSSAQDNRYTYTGREWDEELQLYHYRARMYDPELGRFCSKDPIRYWNGYNLYSARFVPSLTDPSGMICEDKKKPCADADGKGGLDPDTEKVYHLCMALCKWSLPIKNPADICKMCKKLPPPARPMCKYLCKEAKKLTPLDDVPDPKAYLCDKACCSGKLPDAMPGDECVTEFYEEVVERGLPPIPPSRKPRTRVRPRTRKEGERACLRCCDDKYPDNQQHKSMCQKQCTLEWTISEAY